MTKSQSQSQFFCSLVPVANKGSNPVKITGLHPGAKNGSQFFDSPPCFDGPSGEGDIADLWPVSGVSVYRMQPNESNGGTTPEDNKGRGDDSALKDIGVLGEVIKEIGEIDKAVVEFGEVCCGDGFVHAEDTDFERGASRLNFSRRRGFGFLDVACDEVEVIVPVLKRRLGWVERQAMRLDGRFRRSRARLSLQRWLLWGRGQSPLNSG